MVSPMRGTQGMANRQVLQEDINDRLALAQARIEAAVGAIWSGSGWSNYLKWHSSLASTAAHGTGGRVPGIDAALQARRDTTPAETPAPELWQLQQRGISGAT